MNTRLKEISRQIIVDMRAKRKDLPPLDDVVLNKIMELREEYDKKFAELIVQECLNVIECSRIEGDEGVCLVGATKYKINQHFGVEE